jgi:hypothetical protein
MYLKSNNLVRSPNQCCHGGATMGFLCIVVDLNVAVNNIKWLSVAMERQKYVSFALLSSYKIFRTALNITVIKLPSKVTDIVVTL